MGKQVVYKGTIRGSVTGESKIKMTSTIRNPLFKGTCFAMKLEEKIGIVGIPDEILVYFAEFGYFRIGDKVIVQGQIVKEDLKNWGRPYYILEADHYYNESLQIGD
nr:hypothetical protein [Candidatus Freyarchaeota archaeon]